MSLPTRTFVRALGFAALALALLTPTAGASSTAEQSTYPNDLSPAGLRAAASIGDAAAQAQLESTILPEVTIEALRTFVIETRALGLSSRKGRVSFDLGLPNVRANDPAQAPDRVGEAQSEVSVCVNGDTVVVAWNDSRAFTVGSSPGVGSLSGYAYSLDGGATFTDGGSVPRALATDAPSGDTDIDTDGRGNWYCNSIYTRAVGAPGPTAQQNISVHNGTFIAGVLVWNTPVMASIGTSATGVLDKCLLTADRLTGNVYVAYTRFISPAAIEIVRSTDFGATWSVPIILDNTIIPTSSKQAANPICGPGGEVYVVWEKGANLINCPDAGGTLLPTQAQIAFSKSTDNGLTFTPFSIIAQPITGFMASGPGDNRERANEFPDIGVDRSGLINKYNGRIYVTYHDTAPWTTNLGGGVAYVEASATNGQAGSPEPIVIGNNVSGSLSSTTDFDYYSFPAVQGNSYMFALDPQGFNCGVSGTTRGMRLRLYANTTPAPTSTFSDSLLAASNQGAFTDRIIWTAPATGTYKLRLSPASGTYPATYVLKLRDLTFAPAGGSRDVRDVMVTSSADGGATWTVPMRVNDDPAGLENRRPFISVDGKGHVHTFWHDSRTPGLGSNAALTTLFGTTSRDGGATWTPNYCVSDERSFFSFNTIAIPNMGDYNTAASSGDLTIPAWSDQRISTGDVFNPVSLAYTAGLGPESYTARIRFRHAIACPADQIVADGTSANLQYCITNTGTVPDSYNWTATDPSGWITSTPSGNTGVIAPGATVCVTVTVLAPVGCVPTNSTVVTFAATPVGDANGTEQCATNLHCDVVVPALIAFFDAALEGSDVRLTWSAMPSTQVVGFNLYRGVNPEAILERVNPGLISVGSGGEFSFVDNPEFSGTVWYRLAAVSRTGEEVSQSIISLNVNALPTAYSFRLAGANPFKVAAGIRFAYTLPQASSVRLSVFDVAGRKVASIVDTEQPAGAYNVSLQSAGRILPAGGYVARLEAGSFSRTIRIIALP